MWVEFAATTNGFKAKIDLPSNRHIEHKPSIAYTCSVGDHLYIADKSDPSNLNPEIVEKEREHTPMSHIVNEKKATKAFCKKYLRLVSCPFRILYHRRDIDDITSNYVL